MSDPVTSEAPAPVVCTDARVKNEGGMSWADRMAARRAGARQREREERIRKAEEAEAERKRAQVAEEDAYDAERAERFAADPAAWLAAASDLGDAAYPEPSHSTSPSSSTASDGQSPASITSARLEKPPARQGASLRSPESTARIFDDPAPPIAVGRLVLSPTAVVVVYEDSDPPSTKGRIVRGDATAGVVAGGGGADSSTGGQVGCEGLRGSVEVIDGGDGGGGGGGKDGGGNDPAATGSNTNAVATTVAGGGVDARGGEVVGRTPSAELSSRVGEGDGCGSGSGGVGGMVKDAPVRMERAVVGGDDSDNYLSTSRSAYADGGVASGGGVEVRSSSGGGAAERVDGVSGGQGGGAVTSEPHEDVNVSVPRVSSGTPLSGGQGSGTGRLSSSADAHPPLGEVARSIPFGSSSTDFQQTSVGEGGGSSGSGVPGGSEREGGVQKGGVTVPCRVGSGAAADAAQLLDSQPHGEGKGGGGGTGAVAAGVTVGAEGGGPSPPLSSEGNTSVTPAVSGVEGTVVTTQPLAAASHPPAGAAAAGAEAVPHASALAARTDDNGDTAETGASTAPTALPSSSTAAHPEAEMCSDDAAAAAMDEAGTASSAVVVAASLSGSAVAGGGGGGALSSGASLLSPSLSRPVSAPGGRSGGFATGAVRHRRAVPRRRGVVISITQCGVADAVRAYDTLAALGFTQSACDGSVTMLLEHPMWPVQLRPTPDLIEHVVSTVAGAGSGGARAADQVVIVVTGSASGCELGTLYAALPDSLVATVQRVSGALGSVVVVWALREAPSEVDDSVRGAAGDGDGKSVSVDHVGGTAEGGSRVEGVNGAAVNGKRSGGRHPNWLARLPVHAPHQLASSIGGVVRSEAPPTARGVAALPGAMTVYDGSALARSTVGAAGSSAAAEGGGGEVGSSGLGTSTDPSGARLFPSSVTPRPYTTADALSKMEQEGGEMTGGRPPFGTTLSFVLSAATPPPSGTSSASSAQASGAVSESSAVLAACVVEPTAAHPLIEMLSAAAAASGGPVAAASFFAVTPSTLPVRRFDRGAATSADVEASSPSASVGGSASAVGGPSGVEVGCIMLRSSMRLDVTTPVDALSPLRAGVQDGGSDIVMAVLLESLRRELAAASHLRAVVPGGGVGGEARTDAVTYLPPNPYVNPKGYMAVRNGGAAPLRPLLPISLTVEIRDVAGLSAFDQNLDVAAVYVGSSAHLVPMYDIGVGATGVMGGLAANSLSSGSGIGHEGAVGGSSDRTALSYITNALAAKTRLRIPATTQCAFAVGVEIMRMQPLCAAVSLARAGLMLSIPHSAVAAATAELYAHSNSTNGSNAGAFGGVVISCDEAWLPLDVDADDPKVALPLRRGVPPRVLVGWRAVCDFDTAAAFTHGARGTGVDVVHEASRGAGVSARPFLAGQAPVPVKRIVDGAGNGSHSRALSSFPLPPSAEDAVGGSGGGTALGSSTLGSAPPTRPTSAPASAQASTTVPHGGGQPSSVPSSTLPTAVVNAQIPSKPSPDATASGGSPSVARAHPTSDAGQLPSLGAGRGESEALQGDTPTTGVMPLVNGGRPASAGGASGRAGGVRSDDVEFRVSSSPSLSRPSTAGYSSRPGTASGLGGVGFSSRPLSAGTARSTLIKRPTPSMFDSLMDAAEAFNARHSGRPSPYYLSNSTAQGSEHVHEVGGPVVTLAGGSVSSDGVGSASGLARGIGGGQGRHAARAVRLEDAEEEACRDARLQRAKLDTDSLRRRFEALRVACGEATIERGGAGLPGASSRGHVPVVPKDIVDNVMQQGIGAAVLPKARHLLNAFDSQGSNVLTFEEFSRVMIAAAGY